MKHISLFSGIGGFDLAAQWAGWTNIASCEINPFGRKHLEYYWPEAYHHDDIKTLTGSIIEHEAQRRYGPDWRADGVVLSGGFPCQPYSLAGKRLGKNDDRHLWPEMLRVIREVRPTYIVGENVFGLINWSNGLVFDEVQSDLEAIGYEVTSFVLPACATSAPHRRDRVWIIAYREGIIKQKKSNNYEWQTSKHQSHNRTTVRDRTLSISGDRNATNAANIGQEQPWNTRERRSGLKDSNSDTVGATTNANGERHEKRDIATVTGEQERQYCKEDFRFRNTDWHNFPTQPPVCFGNDGIPARLDGITFSKWRNESIKAAGNAVVPQVVFRIFNAINEINKINNFHSL